LNTEPTDEQTSGKRRAVSVVCPFFNEAAIIREAAETMASRLAEDFDDWELILVNDGSDDESLDTVLDIREAQWRDWVKIVSYQPNRGRGHALRQGIRAASHDIIVTTEVDLSWGDDIVRRLHDALVADDTAHFVIASPQIADDGYHLVPLSRRLISRWGNRLIGLFFRGGVTMHTGMTRAYRREVVQPMEFQSNGKEFHLEVLLKLMTLGFKPIEIPATISWAARNRAGDRSRPRSQVFNRRMLGTISSHLLFVALARPMAYFGVISALIVLSGMGFGAAAIWNLIFGGVSVFFAVIALILFLFGALFMGFAVVFTQLREISREGWLDHYPDHTAARTSVKIYGAERE
jgi:glycosyltransferase involved in cell wall biosynthesis